MNDEINKRMRPVGYRLLAVSKPFIAELLRNPAGIPACVGIDVPDDLQIADVRPGPRDTVELRVGSVTFKSPDWSPKDPWSGLEPWHVTFKRAPAPLPRVVDQLRVLEREARVLMKTLGDGHAVGLAPIEDVLAELDRLEPPIEGVATGPRPGNGQG